MLVEEQYNRLSEQVYWVEQKRKDVLYTPLENMTYFYDKDNHALGQFQVLKVEDNVANGMQAMAVAPVVEGKEDESKKIRNK